MADSSIVSEMRPFFHPRTIAVIGVSRDPTKFGSCVFRAVKEFGYRGKLYPVGRLDEFMGEKAYPSVTEIPGEVDLARVCMPAPLVPATVEECKKKGVPAVEVLSTGFGETGTAEGKQLQAEIASFAGDGMRIIGPNCFGIYSPASGVPQLPGTYYPQEAGCLGFISQSGGNTEDFCRPCDDYGLRISKAASYGNACDITEVDLLRYFEADDETKIVTGYVEGIKGDGREFFETVKRLAARKPVILLKGGLTPGGARMVASHTASLAGSDRIWTALFRQTGVIEVNTLEELLDTASAFYHLPPQADNRVGLVCGAGGISVIASDASHRAGLVLPAFSDEIREKLDSFPALTGTNHSNPVDCNVPFPAAELFKDVLETVGTAENIGSIVIAKVALSAKLRQLLGYAKQYSYEDPSWLKELPVEARQKTGLPVIVVLNQVGDLACEEERRQLRRYYQREGVAVYPTVERALQALGRMVRYYQYRQRDEGA